MAVTGSFTATGQSAQFQPTFPPATAEGTVYQCATIELWIYGGSGSTITLERSIDNGTTWLKNRITVAGTETVFDQFTTVGYAQIQDIPQGTLLRLNCTVYGGTQVNYQVGRAQ